MLRLATDADFHGAVYRGLLRRQPDLNIVRVQDAGLRTAADEDILQWAASHERILLTHDRETMPKLAYDRVGAGLAMPGVFVLRNRPEQIGQMIDDVLLVALCSGPEEWKGRVEFLPI